MYLWLVSLASFLLFSHQTGEFIISSKSLWLKSLVIYFQLPYFMNRDGNFGSKQVSAYETVLT